MIRTSPSSASKRCPREEGLGESENPLRSNGFEVVGSFFWGGSQPAPLDYRYCPRRKNWLSSFRLN